jgi:hypothetical protein
MKPKKPIETLILNLRNQKVILDSDLAELYGVATKVFNQAVKRNPERFPGDFCFQLTAAEFENLKSESAAPNSQAPRIEGVAANWSQFVTSSKRHRGAACRPCAFTEHGAIMAATVLNSPQAVAMWHRRKRRPSPAKRAWMRPKAKSPWSSLSTRRKRTN